MLSDRQEEETNATHNDCFSASSSSFRGAPALQFGCAQKLLEAEQLNKELAAQLQAKDALIQQQQEALRRLELRPETKDVAVEA